MWLDSALGPIREPIDAIVPPDTPPLAGPVKAVIEMFPTSPLALSSKALTSRVLPTSNGIESYPHDVTRVTFLALATQREREGERENAVSMGPCDTTE